MPARRISTTMAAVAATSAHTIPQRAAAKLTSTSRLAKTSLAVCAASARRSSLWSLRAARPSNQTTNRFTIIVQPRTTNPASETRGSWGSRRRSIAWIVRCWQPKNIIAAIPSAANVSYLRWP